jgi:1-acyl-sn-glycerol-3-phosphate acyltransferase
LAKKLYDLEVTGREHLPDGAFVIAANHFSFIDPVMLTLAAQRNVRYLAVAGIFDTHHLFDRLISFFGAIPTPRDVVPVGAIRTSLADLDSGEILGIFPEGRRVAKWRETYPTRGAAWLALAAGVPMVPVAIEGTQDTLGVVETAFRRTSIRIWIDAPLHPEDYVGYVDPTAAMMRDWMEVVGRRLDPWWVDSTLENTPS